MWHPEPDLLALAALPAELRDAEVDAHLEHCALCRGHVESLRRTVDLALSSDGRDLHDTHDSDAPPDRVWRAITEELSTRERPVAVRSRWRRFALPVAAAVVGVAVGLGVGVAIAGAPQPSTPVARLAPVSATDRAGSGTVEMVTAGGARQMVVRLDGVTTLDGADFLEVWLMDAGGSKLLALGSLARDGTTFRGTFTVPADLPAGEFDTVDVSAEKWDGNPDHSRLSLLRGPLT